MHILQNRNCRSGFEDNSPILHGFEDCRIERTVNNSPKDDRLHLTEPTHTFPTESNIFSTDSDVNGDNLEQATSPLHVNEKMDNNIDMSLLEQHRHFVAKSPYKPTAANRTAFSDLHHVQIELLSLLKRAQAPLYLYDEIMRWAHRSTMNSNEPVFVHPPLSRATVMKNLYKSFNLGGIKPRVVNTVLPESGTKVRVVTHCAKQSIYSLLTDPTLMTDNNLLFHGDDPTLPPFLVEEEVLGDIHTGNVYKHAWSIYCTKPGDVLCPLVFFIDKTHTDTNGNLCLEPVTFTLGIFKRSLRNNPKAWRTLGFIPNQDMNKKTTGASTSSSVRACDYHAALHVIFESIRALQGSNGVAWDLKYKGVSRRVTFKFPILFITGDTEGHDKLVGKYLSRSSSVSRHCRYCDCSSQFTGNPYAKFVYVQQAEVKKLLDEGNTKRLKEMSQHYLKNGNAFHSLQFCDPDRGVHGATPAEIVHMLQQGLLQYAASGLFSCRRTNQSFSRKRKAPQAELNAEVIYEPPDPDEESRLFVFSESVKAELDEYSKIIGKQLQHQSDRSLPRTSFPKGICPSNDKGGLRSKKNIRAHEEGGIILLLLMIMCSSWAEDVLDQRMGQLRLASFIQLFEQLLLYEDLLKAHAISRRHVYLLKRYTPILLNHFSRTVNRTEGVGCNFIKFHLPLHIGDDILRNGVCQNSSSACGESGHKAKCKQPAKQTQRVLEQFELQTAIRSVDNIVIDRAHDELLQLPSLDVTEPFIEEQDFDSATRFAGRNYVCNVSGMFDSKTNDKSNFCKGRTSQWSDENLQRHVYDLVSSFILPNVDGQSVDLLTQFTRNNVIYRAHPAYKGGDAWQDWAYINWSPAGLIPGHLLIFLDLRGVQKSFHIKESTIDRPGIYAVVHSVFESLDKKPHFVDATRNGSYLAHSSSLLVYYAQKELYDCSQTATSTSRGKRSKDESFHLVLPKLYVVPCECIHSPCVAVPDIGPKAKPHGFLFLRSRKEWPKCFFRLMKDTLKKIGTNEKGTD